MGSLSNNYLSLLGYVDASAFSFNHRHLQGLGEEVYLLMRYNGFYSSRMKELNLFLLKMAAEDLIPTAFCFFIIFK